MAGRLLNDFRRLTCPLCDSPKLSQVGCITYELPVLFSSTSVMLELAPELWKCDECRSGMVQNALPESAAQQLYSQSDSTRRWSTMAFEQHKPQEIIAELSRLFTEGKEHLDVGCNAGNLLDFSRKRGCVTTGVEYSSKTRGLLEEKGHAWFPSFEALGDKDFDVITAFDLIEHLYDVRAFIRECRRRLRAGGRLVILTGNMESVSARLARQHWWYASYPEHIVFPSVRFFKECASYTLERCVHTYASIGYRHSLQARLRGFVGGMLRGRYRGLPAVGPDHMLLVLGT